MVFTADDLTSRCGSRVKSLDYWSSGGQGFKPQHHKVATAGPLRPFTLSSPGALCHDRPQLPNKLCYNVYVTRNDFYSKWFIFSFMCKWVPAADLCQKLRYENDFITIYSLFRLKAGPPPQVQWLCTAFPKLLHISLYRNLGHRFTYTLFGQKVWGHLTIWFFLKQLAQSLKHRIV